MWTGNHVHEDSRNISVPKNTIPPNLAANMNFSTKVN
jgi:hypothetical protein